MIVLDIYITENCWSCEESVRIANDLASLFSGVKINLLSFQENEVPEEVFAVPTYVLNGKIIYLGNPTREELIEKISAVQMSISAN